MCFYIHIKHINMFRLHYLLVAMILVRKLEGGKKTADE